MLSCQIILFSAKQYFSKSKTTPVNGEVSQKQFKFEIVHHFSQVIKTIVFFSLGSLASFNIGLSLPSATKLGQGNIFRSMCQEFCPQGGHVW